MISSIGLAQPILEHQPARLNLAPGNAGLVAARRGLRRLRDERRFGSRHISGRIGEARFRTGLGFANSGANDRTQRQRRLPNGLIHGCFGLSDRRRIGLRLDRPRRLERVESNLSGRDSRERSILSARVRTWAIQGQLALPQSNRFACAIVV